MINSIELNNYLEKLKFYIKEEIVTNEEIVESLNCLISCYNTSNTKIFKELNNDLSKVLNNICVIHNNDINIIKNSLENYLVTARKVENIFKDIKLK